MEIMNMIEQEEFSSIREESFPIQEQELLPDQSGCGRPAALVFSEQLAECGPGLVPASFIP